MNKYKNIYRFKETTSDHFVKLFSKYNETENPDYHIVVDPEFVEPVIGSASFEIPNFEDISSFDAAKIIYNSLKKAKQPVPFYFNDTGMWEWLSYIFYENLSKKLGDLSRYSPNQSPSSREWNRHLIRTAVWVFENFGDDSKVYLNANLSEGGDLVETWTQSAAMLEPNMMQLLTILFFDDETQKLKRGHANKKPGDHRDLISFIKQLRFTHKVEEMSGERLVELLPERFDKWKE